jgi:xanthine dehydrogenase small subunit
MNIENGLIKDCRIAFGGMAATPKRALITEGSLKGKTWCYEAINEASKMLNEDFSPLSDWRATKEYRMTVARNLLHRFFLEHDLEIIEPIQLHARF